MENNGINISQLASRSSSINTVDGSEIRRSPVDMVDIPFFTGFHEMLGGFYGWIFHPSTKVFLAPSNPHSYKWHFVIGIRLVKSSVDQPLSLLANRTTPKRRMTTGKLQKHMVSLNRSKYTRIEHLGAFTSKKYPVPKYLMFFLGYLFRTRRCPQKILTFYSSSGVCNRWGGFGP